MSLILAMFMISLIGVAFMFGGALEKLVAFFETPVGTDLTTLMGRYRIWEIAVQEWRNNPFFGYGLTMWNEEYRIRVGMTDFAYTAHNQFFQSLAVAGIIGVTGLAIYALTLLWFVLKTTKASQGLTLALFVLLSVQSVTEVPLSMTSGFGLAQQVHLLLLMVLASRIPAGSIESPGTRASARPRLAPS
jgi:O-antigen ligase